jgi:kynurenine formamidase
VYTLAAHLNGTHTECVGHISRDRVAIHDTLRESLIPATLITIAPALASDSGESYDPAFRKEDHVITRTGLERAINRDDRAFLQGLVVRTTPNDSTKQTRDYGKSPPAFFTMEAMRYLGELDVQHLVTDLPSIDRLSDEGKLTNHHIYWDVPLGHHPTANDPISNKTITELVYAADDIADGRYLLNLQIAPFMADASPSRVFLYELTPR